MSGLWDSTRGASLRNVLPDDVRDEIEEVVLEENGFFQQLWAEHVEANYSFYLFCVEIWKERFKALKALLKRGFDDDAIYGVTLAESQVFEIARLEDSDGENGHNLAQRFVLDLLKDEFSEVVAGWVSGLAHEDIENCPLANLTVRERRLRCQLLDHSHGMVFMKPVDWEKAYLYLEYCSKGSPLRKGTPCEV